ncbi:hypothetical protein AB0I52_12545 [Streptomyces sp. NPDC050423]|uniref:hypothetical protein n=1 Tax=Streptomyces sp. NPDC050423 TaxID=3155402 RepID=UPI00342792BC
MRAHNSSSISHGLAVVFLISTGSPSSAGINEPPPGQPLFGARGPTSRQGVIKEYRRPHFAYSPQGKKGTHMADGFY